MTDQDLYAWAFSNGLSHQLFEFDQVLSGKADKASFRLTPERYQEARAAIVTLYRIVKQPELEPTPRATAVQMAHRDVRFQEFLRSSLAKRKRMEAT
jgi:hypothetical protein